MANQIFASKQPCLRPPRWSYPQVRGMEMSPTMKNNTALDMRLMVVIDGHLQTVLP
jgi:hypothetical protein